MKTMKRFSVIIVACFLTIGLMCTPAFTASAAADAQGADFRSGMIKYILEDPLIDTPNTFEAFVKVEKDAPHRIGSIFSNEVLRSSPNLTVSYFMNEAGNICVNWNSGEKNVIFDSYDLRNGEWTHIAVVRSEERGRFSLYVNGDVVQDVACGAGESVKAFTMEHCIGGDWHSQQNEKNPFPGRIGSLTLYARALNAGEIRKDYYNSDKISAQTREELIFHADISLGDVKLTDTSVYRNDAYLGSNDYFYNGEIFETQDYTLAVLPDIQMLTNHYQAPIETLPAFLLENAESKKIGALLTVGDLTDGLKNGKDWDRQYNKISSELAKLDGKIPYIAVPGNHDYDNECDTDFSVTHFNKAFPISKMSGWECWGGSFSGESIVNAYYLMEFCGVKYLIFALDFGASDAVLEWCCEITEQYPDRRVIVTTHAFLGSSGEMIGEDSAHNPGSYGWADNSSITVNNPDQMWEKFLKRYPNIFMTVSGHVSSDDIVVREFRGDHGNIVASFLLNQQAIIMNDGLELLLGLFSFDEKDMNVYVNYYSTIQDKLYNLQNQFVYSFAGNTDLLSTVYYPSGKTETTVVPDRAEILSSAVSSWEGFGTKAPQGSVSGGIFFGAIAAAVVIAGIIVYAAKRRRK